MHSVTLLVQDHNGDTLVQIALQRRKISPRDAHSYMELVQARGTSNTKRWIKIVAEKSDMIFIDNAAQTERGDWKCLT
jgi:hypothetical protein